jgi:hypothetical protein
MIEGSGSRRLKNIRIRIRNTDTKLWTFSSRSCVNNIVEKHHRYQGPRGLEVPDHELYLKRPLVSSSGGAGVQYEKEFHKIRIFALYEDPGGGGAFTAGIMPNSERKIDCKQSCGSGMFIPDPGFF